MIDSRGTDYPARPELDVSPLKSFGSLVTGVLIPFLLAIYL